MADPIQQYPSDALLTAAREYRSIQEEVAEIFFKQGKSIQDIIGLEKNLSKGIVARIGRQRELVDLIKQSKEALIQAEKKTQSAALGVDRERAKADEKSTRQMLSGLQAEYDILSKINKQAMIPWLYFLKQAWGLFVSMDKAAESFRMKMGVFRKDISEIRSMAQKLAVDFMHVGLTIDGAYAAIGALGKEMGGIRVITQDLVKTTALLKAQLGVTEEDSAGFFRNMAAVSKSTMQAQENMAYMAQDLAQAAGVPLPQIMNDVAKMSSQTLTMISRVPNQILRSAIEARRMNTSLSDMAKSGREILNFSDNINAEMEASVLLGRSINLQRARQLAYNRDLVGSTKEILRITRNINFENLDVFQQEAFARATGKSVDELMRMVQAEKQWDAARRSSDPKIRSQVEQYDKLLKLNEESAKARAKDIGLMVQQQANQQRLTEISNKWNQVIAKGTEVLLPVIDALLSIAPIAIDIGMAIMKWSFVLGAPLLVLNKISKGMMFLLNVSSSISARFLPLANFFGKILAFTNRILGPITSIGAKITGWLGPLAKFITPFFKLLGPIGWIITAFQGISGFIRGWTSSTGTFSEKLKSGVMGALRAIIPGFDWIVNGIKWVGEMWWKSAKFVMNIYMSIFKGIWEGIKWVGGLIYAALIQPYVTFYNWLKKKFLGNSPSGIGLEILKGIVSVGAMIYDALTAPFRKGLAWIADKIPGMGKVASKLRGGATELISKPVETRAAAAYVPAVTVTPNGTRVAGAPAPTQQGGTTQEKKETNNSDKLLQDILTAINALNANLEAGKIGINMDGQLLSATLARQTEFRGGYGVNKV